ncbi:S-adenosyl-L-methionine-dependent methyltransferase [Scenedesmus sp. PABB004]|nr:S-adenosyl-L-methionine-dependent methyltransferase [Scenedesmus sp. PABB004]
MQQQQQNRRRHRPPPDAAAALLADDAPLDAAEQDAVIAVLEAASAAQARGFRLALGALALLLAAAWAHGAAAQLARPWEARYTGELRPVCSARGAAAALAAQAAGLAAAGAALLWRLPPRDGGAAAAARRGGGGAAPAELARGGAAALAAGGALTAGGALYWARALLASAARFGPVLGGHWELAWLPALPLAAVGAAGGAARMLASNAAELAALRALRYEFKKASQQRAMAPVQPRGGVVGVKVRVSTAAAPGAKGAAAPPPAPRRSPTPPAADADDAGSAPLLSGFDGADGAASAAAFDALCNAGAVWGWDNWRVKAYRYTLMLLKQIYLPFMTRALPTNHLMLTFRTLTRDFDEPNANEDHLAAAFRDAVMPARGRLHAQRSVLVRINRVRAAADRAAGRAGLLAARRARAPAPHTRPPPTHPTTHNQLRQWFLEVPFLGIPGIVRFIDVRTQWFDEALKAALRDGIKQVVVIAAGYDTRAYRLGAPGVKFYEIDLPHASAKKQELVRDLLPASKGYSRPEFVAADLSKVKLADALAGTSFDPTQRTFFTVEGLVYYLPAGAVRQLLSCVSTISAPGSRLLLDFLHLSCLSGRVWNPGFETLMISVWNKGETMHSGIDERPEAVEAMLRQFDFHTQEVLTSRDMVKRFMPHATYEARPKATVSPYFGYLAAEKL